MKGLCRVKSNKNEEVYIKNQTMKNELLKKLMGMVDIEPNNSLTCAYKLRLDLMIDDELDISKESESCLSCSGFPESCWSYCSLDHIIDYYKTMRLER